MLYPNITPTEVFAAWNQVIGAALRSTMKLAKLNGEMIDHIVRWQLYDWNTGFVSGTQCIYHTWEILLPESSKAKDKRARVALVTGGVGGIGTEICKKLADAGHWVVATHLASEGKAARKWRADRQAEGYKISLVECDVTSFKSCARMAEQVQAEFGAVDILVNCAGITGDKTLRKMDRDKWPSVLDTNLDSMFNVIRNLIDGMIGRHYGRIINISSVNGQRDQLGQAQCAASLAGMIGFTRSLARELADQGITVNAVSPDHAASSLAMTIPEELRKQIIDKIPVGCLGQPAEIAHTVAFLAAEESSNITGTDIAINGGLSMA